MEEVGSVRMKNSPETTQVLIVLSDNGVEEIPFQSNHEKSENNVNYMEPDDPATKPTIFEKRKLTRARNHSLPASLARHHQNGKPNHAMDYLQVPTNMSSATSNVPPATSDEHGQMFRRASTSSMGSKSSLSSFGIYSAPDTPMTPISPTPSTASPFSMEAKRKFTFPQADGEMHNYMLNTFQMSRSTDALRAKDEKADSRLSLQWPEGGQNSSRKKEQCNRKKSLLERLGSSMSEKSLLSRRLRRSMTNWSSGQSSKDHFSDGTISFPKSKRSKTKQKFRIVAAKTGQPDGISFECIDKPGCFLRAKGKSLSPEREGSDSYFNKDSTFVPLPDMWFQGFFAFESVGKPSYFIRLNQTEELILDRYDGTSTFKEDASFMLKKRPCATCLQVGVKGWSKMPSGGYCLGKVVAVNEMIEVSLDDNRIMKYPRNSQGSLIPDVVPQPNELSVGARVISQWFDREFLYPGIITGVKSNEYEVQFDDGDKGRCRAYQIRLVRDHLFQDHSCVSPSHNHVIKQASEETVPEQCDGVDDRLLSCIKRQQFSESRQGKLWSRDGSEITSHISKEEISKKDSSSSTDTQSHGKAQNEGSKFKRDLRLTVQNLKVSSLETETMSQDSGYHGYLRQRSLEKESQKKLLAALPKWKTQEEEAVETV